MTVYPEFGKVWDRRVDKSGVTGSRSLGVKVWFVSKSIDLNWIDFVKREVVVEETEVVAGKDIVIGRIVVVSSKSKSSSGSSEINLNQSADNRPWRRRRCLKLNCSSCCFQLTAIWGGRCCAIERYKNLLNSRKTIKMKLLKSIFVYEKNSNQIQISQIL